MSDRHERECVNLARENGFGAMRTPASGRGNDVSLPDLMLYSPYCGLLAGEHKYTSVDDMCFDSDRDISAVKEFAKIWDAVPVLIARFSQDTNHYVIEVDSSSYQEMLTRTGNIRPKKEDTDDYEELMNVLEKESAPLVV